MKALFYKPPTCTLCPHNCNINEGKCGICGVRQLTNGELVTLVYGKACAIAIDPIEKKPLFHFKPGSMTLSMATVGCNMSCPFCQNADISQNPKIFGKDVLPEDIVQQALDSKSESISYTYTEPTVFF